MLHKAVKFQQIAFDLNGIIVDTVHNREAIYMADDEQSLIPDPDKQPPTPDAERCITTKVRIFYIASCAVLALLSIVSVIFLPINTAILIMMLSASFMAASLIGICQLDKRINVPIVLMGLCLAACLIFIVYLQVQRSNTTRDFDAYTWLSYIEYNAKQAAR